MQNPKSEWITEIESFQPKEKQHSLALFIRGWLALEPACNVPTRLRRRFSLQRVPTREPEPLGSGGGGGRGGGVGNMQILSQWVDWPPGPALPQLHQLPGAARSPLAHRSHFEKKEAGRQLFSGQSNVFRLVRGLRASGKWRLRGWTPQDEPGNLQLWQPPRVVPADPTAEPQAPARSQPGSAVFCAAALVRRSSSNRRGSKWQAGGDSLRSGPWSQQRSRLRSEQWGRPFVSPTWAPWRRHTLSCM